jgi:Leu/Phe-tRNA-protein transferase
MISNNKRQYEPPGQESETWDTEAIMGGQWAEIPKDRIKAIIEQQMTRYRKRPFLNDIQDLHTKIANDLTLTMKGDFAWSLNFRPSFLAALMFEGFLPICCELGGGSGLYCLLPKLHEQRCILAWDSLYVSKRNRQKAKKFVLTHNTAFDQVVTGCIKQHGESWLWPPMRQIFGALFSHGRLHPAFAVQMHSFELWQDNELVAGELGCVVGAVYTSFTGFYTVASSGSVQMLLTALLLRVHGCHFWDLGQHFDYKIKLGACMVPRAEFLRQFHKARVCEHVTIPSIRYEISSLSAAGMGKPAATAAVSTEGAGDAGGTSALAPTQGLSQMS